MKIFAPFDSVREVAPLIDAGADELYCGVLHQEWLKRRWFSNARHVASGNLSSFEELEKGVKIAHEHNVLLYVCFNDYYVKEQWPLVCRDIEKAAEVKVDGFIIADILLVATIKKVSPQAKIVLSSLSPCFNHYALSFYKSQGVDRVVLPPSQLSSTETEKLIQAGNERGLEIEVFANNIGCKNVNGFCLFHNKGIENYFVRRKKMSYKRFLYFSRMIVRLLPRAGKRALQKLYKLLPYRSNLACRARSDIRLYKHNNPKQTISIIRNVSHERDFSKKECMHKHLLRFKEAGAAAAKIVGRGNLLQNKITDIKRIKAIRDADITSRAGQQSEIVNSYLERNKEDVFLATLYKK